MDPREASLPKWAQTVITDLRERVVAATDPLIRELGKFRPQMELLQRRNEALTELLECAARGGHKTSQEIIAIIEGYDLTVTKKESNP